MYAKSNGFVQKLIIKGAIVYQVELGVDIRGNMTRIDNALNKISEKLEDYKIKLSNILQQQEAAREEVGKPFPYEDELRQKSARLAELDAELNLSTAKTDINAA